MVEYCDRKLVYSAVARLHSAGLTYNSLVDSGLMVCGGKLKFTNLAAIDVGTEQFKELDWQLVDELFSPDRRGIPNMCDRTHFHDRTLTDCAPGFHLRPMQRISSPFFRSSPIRRGCM